MMKVGRRGRNGKVDRRGKQEGVAEDKEIVWRKRE